ncbi:MAG: Serine/threonine protein kinase PrkC, regulator of stationary phase [Labilithrix sp.]|nr:Serine/threonine protein kinase PrkC, regulator of stationary phase [Labilithrix sp.]
MTTNCAQCQKPIDEGAAVCPFCRTLQPSRGRSRTLAAGTQIDRGYGKIIVDERIGSGAMGTVYRAWLFWDPKGPRGEERPALLALKQLKPQASIQPELRAFFQNEAEALQLLAHPNVVRFHELFTWTPTLSGGPPLGPAQTPPHAVPAAPILAMEYVDGDTLENVVARNVARAQLAGQGALPGLQFHRAWYYFQQLLGALAATHALGIVHRDVKPSNIMIRRDGIVKLTDYGIAHLVKPRHGLAAPSPQELAPGTGAYMSPEQVLGHHLDGRSDLYSAGIVLYEMLSGRPPFLPSEKSEFALRMDQVETAPPPIRRLVPQLPAGLDVLFDRALAKAPSSRFATAIEMGEAFRAAFGLPITPAWEAQGEIVIAVAVADPAQRAQRLATLRQVVKKEYRTQPMPQRPVPRAP